MPTTLRPYQPDRLLLLSPELRERLPPGDLAHHVSDLIDALELNGEGIRGDELSAELQRRPKRLAAIHEAKARLAAVQREANYARGRKPGQDRNLKGGRPYRRGYAEPEPAAQSNFTGPDIRAIRTTVEGFQQRYKAQDGGRRSAPTHCHHRDRGQRLLPPLLDEVSESFEIEPEVVVVGVGYCNEADLVALRREGKAQALEPERRPATHRVGEKLASANGLAQYAERKWLSEGTNSWVKEVLRLRLFSLRGVEKVRDERHLVCIALSVNPMWGWRCVECAAGPIAVCDAKSPTTTI